ncbi:MAG: hypothetical protein JXR40_13135 [Pontiellaceae bacterium]|nr:hypothetical protein [Pontiellaceae bacterium]
MNIRALLAVACLIGVAGCTTLEREKSASNDNPSVEHILRKAAETSFTLQSKAEKPSERRQEEASFMRPYGTGESEPEIEKFPLKRHITEYENARFWAWNYALHEDLPSYSACETVPTEMNLIFIEDNAPTLRTYLTNADVDIRSLAAEALAVLHDPADVPRIAELINDTLDAPPFLDFNQFNSARTVPIIYPAISPDLLILTRSWRKQTVGDYARRALELMTGERFDEKVAFDQWWTTHSGGKDCLWYWQVRVSREIVPLEFGRWREAPLPGESSIQTRERQQAMQTAAYQYQTQAIERALRECPPEVEAKVLLLVEPRVLRQVGLGEIRFSVSDGSEPLWPNAPALRISSDRLIELLEQKNLWSDVDWDKSIPPAGTAYSRMVERMGLWADTLFTPDDVPRLKAVLEKNRKNLWKPAAQALEDGIARLEQSK